MLTLCRKHARAAVAFFFLAVLLLGFFTMDGYGRTWDDLSEINILRMTLREYDLLLPFHTSYGEALERMGVERISESVEKDHGSCLFYPLFWAVCRDDLTQQEMTQIWRCYIWCIFTLGLFALYAVARRMGFSRLMSLTGVLILLLSPRFFAEGHYNNKDIPLMAMVLVLMWQSARLMEKPSRLRAVSFALAAGACAATRIIGAAFVGLFGGMIVLHLWTSRRLSRKAVGLGAFAAAASIAVYVLLTPALLRDPLDFLKYLLQNAVGFSRWHGNLLLFGNVISTSSARPPFYYLPVFIIITTPLWALALLACGGFSALRSLRAFRLRRLASCESTLKLTAFLAWLLPLAACVLLRTLVYNGWRHVYFLYGPMVLCMLCGLNALLRFFSRFRRGARLTACAAALCLLCSAVGIALNHPYQYAYYNALVPVEGRQELFELDWWNLSCTNAMAQLLDENEGEVVVTASDRQTLTGISLASGYLNEERLVINVHEDADREPEYLAANLSYAHMADFQPDDTMEPYITIRSYGAPITVVYRLKEREIP